MLASAPTFLCFLLNMIIKKRADNIRPYDFLMGAQKRRKPFWGEETLRNARGVDFVRNPPQAIWSPCRRGRGGNLPPESYRNIILLPTVP